MTLGAIPVLCIIQARWHSTRLPGKMLLPFGSESLIERAWRIANECPQELYEWVSVVAIPASDEAGPLGEELRRIGAKVFTWDGPEWDVLGRFYHAAKLYRWHPDTVIVRYTADDPFKTPSALRMTARGFRMAPELGGEAWTLGQVESAQFREPSHVATCEPNHDAWRRITVRPNPKREHITDALSPFRWPAYAVSGYTIDTEDDLVAARRILEEQT